jgi:hypothetical protein
VLLFHAQREARGGEPSGRYFVKSVVHVLRTPLLGYCSEFQQWGFLLLLAEQCKQTQLNRLLVGRLSRTRRCLGRGSRNLLLAPVPYGRLPFAIWEERLASTCTLGGCHWRLVRQCRGGARAGKLPMAPQSLNPVPFQIAVFTPEYTLGLHIVSLLPRYAGRRRLAARCGAGPLGD